MLFTLSKLACELNRSKNYIKKLRNDKVSSGYNVKTEIFTPTKIGSWPSFVVAECALRPSAMYDTTW